MRPDVDPGERDPGGQQEQRHREPRREPREHECAREARRGVTRRKRGIPGDVQERLGPRVPERRALDAGGALEPARRELRNAVRERDGKEDPHVPAPQCEQERDGEPHGPGGPDPREADEQRVEPTGSVQDDPVAEMPVEAGQTGTICFVWSISCWRSNGLPTNPRAPRAVASANVSSSTLPLNITTGIAPVP